MAMDNVVLPRLYDSENLPPSSFVVQHVSTASLHVHLPSIY